MYTDIRKILSLWAVHIRLWLDFKVFNPLKSLTHEKRKKYIYIYICLRVYTKLFTEVSLLHSLILLRAKKQKTFLNVHCFKNLVFSASRMD